MGRIVEWAEKSIHKPLGFLQWFLEHPTWNRFTQSFLWETVEGSKIVRVALASDPRVCTSSCRLRCLYLPHMWNLKLHQIPWDWNCHCDYIFDVYLSNIKVRLMQQTAVPPVCSPPHTFFFCPQTSSLLSPQCGHQGQIPACCELAELSNGFLCINLHHTILVPVCSCPHDRALCCWVTRARSLCSLSAWRPRHRHTHPHATPVTWTHACEHQAHVPTPEGT